jgi:hypothetical protein
MTTTRRRVGVTTTHRNPTRSRNATVVAHQRNVTEFILAMTVELGELAYKNGLDSLTVAFDVAREAAEVELSKANLSTLNS